MGFISNSICGYNTKKTIRSSSLSVITKHYSSSSSYYYHYHHYRHYHSSSSSTRTYMEQFQPTKITTYNNSNTGSVTNNILQQSDENACNDERSPTSSYRHSTFRPYLIPQDDENSFRPSRSHESLLAYSSTIDLDGAETKINSFHPSDVNPSNCLKFKNINHNCRNSRERNRWAERPYRFLRPSSSSSSSSLLSLSLSPHHITSSPTITTSPLPHPQPPPSINTI